MVVPILEVCVSLTCTLFPKEFADQYREEQLKQLAQGIFFSAQLEADVRAKNMKSRYFLVQRLGSDGCWVLELSPLNRAHLAADAPVCAAFLRFEEISQLNILLDLD